MEGTFTDGRKKSLSRKAVAAIILYNMVAGVIVVITQDVTGIPDIPLHWAALAEAIYFTNYVPKVAAAARGKK